MKVQRWETKKSYVPRRCPITGKLLWFSWCRVLVEYEFIEFMILDIVDEQMISEEWYSEAGYSWLCITEKDSQ